MWESGGRWYGRVLDTAAYIEVTATSKHGCVAELREIVGDDVALTIEVVPQIAGGADKKAMPYEFKRLKGKAPKLLASQSAWTTPLNATNRLLVGPFKSEKEAQEFVNELAKADLSAFSWTSPAGQEIEKLAVK